jgi:pentatricopeptide repeat protein
MRAQRVPRSPSTYDAAIAASTPSPTPGLALTPGATGDAGAAAGLAAGGLEDAAGGWGASSPWSGAASAGGVRRGGASGGGRAGAGGDASPLGPLIGIIEALLSESPPLIQAVLADQRATSVLLHACAALGRPKEALAILEAGGGGLGATTEGAGGGGLSGPGDALTPSPPPTSPVHVAPSPLSPPPAPLAEWRRLALRACAAGPYADEAASLLRSLGQVASPSAYADAVAAAAAGRRWQDVLALHAALKERIAAPGGGALWGEGGAEGAGALASAGVAAITAHGKLNQLHDAAAVFTDAWPAAHARRVGAAGGGGTGGSGGAGAPGLLAAEAGRAQAGGRSAAVPTQAAASPPPATQPPPALSSSSPPCLPPSPPAPRLIDAYNALLLACLDCNDPQRALALLSAMRAEGHPPNALSLTAAITAAQRLGQHEQVRQNARATNRFRRKAGSNAPK